MKILMILLLALVGCGDSKHEAEANVYAVSEQGVGERLGVVTFSDTPQGMMIEVDLTGLPQGEHGFHIHEYPNCGADFDAGGKLSAAQKAGSHYDPDKTLQHLGPESDGHKGDLPFLTADAQGKVKQRFYSSKLKVNEIKNHSLVVHAGGDNYQDVPQPLGGGGARIACGIIK